MSRDSKSMPSALPEPLQGREQLGPDDTFRFGCHDGLKCYTRCCGDVNIFLTPADVLSLARAVGLSTTDLLEQHTITPIHKDLNLPVVLLRMKEDDKKSCPFLEADGCGVYEARPWACRMYPLGMGIPPARAGETPEPVYFLNEPGFCEGHGEPTEWTVSNWRDNQGVAAREELETGFRDLVSHPWFIGGRQLDPKRMEMLYTSSYDLDAFRRFIFDTSFLERFELESELVEQLRTDDEALLRFAFRWLRYALFAEPTMTVKEGAAKKERKS